MWMVCTLSIQRIGNYLEALAAARSKTLLVPHHRLLQPDCSTSQIRRCFWALLGNPFAVDVDRRRLDLCQPGICQWVEQA